MSSTCKISCKKIREKKFYGKSKPKLKPNKKMKACTFTEPVAYPDIWLGV